MGNIERYLPAPLQGMPAEDWRYIGAAGLLLAGGLFFVAGHRKRSRRGPTLGDPFCPEERYVAAFQAKGWNLDRARRAWLYQPLISHAADHFGVSPALMMGLVHTESGFNPAAGSSAGAYGLGQQMPSTAVGRFMGLVKDGQWPYPALTTPNEDPMASYFADPSQWPKLYRDRAAGTPFATEGVWRYVDRSRPEQSSWMAAAGMASRLKKMDTTYALANYNAGSKVQQGTPEQQWPAETQRYVPGVLRRANFWHDFFNECYGRAAA